MPVAADLLIGQRLSALQHGLQVGKQRRVANIAGAVVIGAEQHLARGLVGEGDIALAINGNNPLFERLQHGLALFKQGGDFIRFQTKKNTLEHPDQRPDAKRADHGAKEHGEQQSPAAVAYLFIHFTERDTDGDHADLLVSGIKYRCKDAQRLGEDAVVDRDILPAM